jgi:uncharacterized membrane protein
MSSMGIQRPRTAGPLMLAVLVLNLMLGLLPSCIPIIGTTAAQTGPDASPPWLDDAFEHRVALTVDQSTFNFEMLNHPAEVDLNFSAMVGMGGFKMDLTSIKLVEYERSDGTYSIVNPNVAFRFYTAFRFDSTHNAVGTLSWVLSGRTEGPRYFYLYFSAMPSSGPGMGLTVSSDQKSLGIIDSNYWIQRGMVFYGFDPGEQSGWANVDEVEVIGLYNGSLVKVFNITDQTKPPSLMSSKVLDRGVLWRYPVPDGDYFKIISDKPVVASVSSAMSGGGSAKTYYPSADRNLVGRDFLMSPYNMTNWKGMNYALQVYAVEDARVSIYDLAGNHITELDVPKDNHKALADLKTGTVYHIVSNGDIMIEQEAINGFTSLPSITGSPVGRKFLGSIQLFDDQIIAIMPAITASGSTENMIIDIYNIDNNTLVKQLSWPNADPPILDWLHFNVDPGFYRIESTGNISVMMGSCEGDSQLKNLGDDITFVGGPGARFITSHLPVNPGPGTKDNQYPGPYYSAIIFPFFNDTNILSSPSVKTKINAGQYQGINGSRFGVESTKPVSIMVLGRGYTDPNADHRWNDWGSYLAGGLLSPKVIVGTIEKISYGIDLYPSPSEGAINDTMVHAVEPGHSTVFRISVNDTGMYPETVALTKGTAPMNWTTTLSTTNLDLQVGRPVELLLTVTVPSNALKDTRVNISVRGDTLRQGTKARNDTVYAEVIVDPVYYPELDGDVLKYVDPGESVTFNITLTNLGNAHDDIMISIESLSDAGWTASLDQANVGLDPSKNITLHLTVTASKNAKAGDRFILDLRARSGTWTNRTSVHRTTTIVRQIYAFNATVPDHIDVMPGSQASCNINIQNLGNGHDIFRIATTGPGNSWTYQVPTSVEAERLQGVDANLKIGVPGKDPKTGLWLQAPGNRTMNINITDLIGIEKTLVLKVHVLQVFGVSLKAPESMIQIRSTEKATFVLTIFNTGNGNDTFTLSSNVRGTFDKYKVSLRPNASTTVNLTVGPQPNRQKYIIFDVTANSSGNATDSTTLTLRVIYPSTHSYFNDYTCLWVVLVAVCVFICVKIAQRRLSKKRP